jgi:hypothetical protein
MEIGFLSRLLRGGRGGNAGKGADLLLAAQLGGRLAVSGSSLFESSLTGRESTTERRTSCKPDNIAFV